MIGDRMTTIRNQQFSNSNAQMRLETVLEGSKDTEANCSSTAEPRFPTGESQHERQQARGSAQPECQHGESTRSRSSTNHQPADHQPGFAPFIDLVTEDDVREAVRNMKSPGNNSIFNLVLKKLFSNAFRFLATRCFQLKYFPTRWKMGKSFPF